ncbi:MAG: LysR family transcriptional regulator [Oceanicoccus sp.]
MTMRKTTGKTQQLPPLIWLRAFRTAAKTGSFKEAAKQLNVSPSTISHEIRKLEKWVNAPLFYRQSGGIDLTPVGVEWISHLETAFELLDTSMQIFKAAGTTQTLRIGALPFVTGEFLLQQLSHLELLAKPRHIQFVSNIHLKSLCRNEANDTVDAVIRYTQEPDDEHFWFELSQVRLAAIASSDVNEISELRRIELGPKSDGWRHFDSIANEKIGSSEAPIVVDNYVSSLKAVEKGLGTALAVLPLSANYIQRSNMKYLSDIRATIPERYWFVCSKSHPQLETLKEMASYLSGCFENE